MQALCRAWQALRGRGKGDARPWLGRLDRYIIYKFLSTYIFLITIIVVIAVIFDFNEQIDKLTRSHAPMQKIIFDYYVNFIPYFANLFSPLFVFIAVIFFTSKLADNSEIIAMKSTGMSFRRLLRPYMVPPSLPSAVSCSEPTSYRKPALSASTSTTATSRRSPTSPPSTTCRCRWTLAWWPTLPTSTT